MSDHKSVILCFQKIEIEKTDSHINILAKKHCAEEGFKVGGKYITDYSSSTCFHHVYMNQNIFLTIEMIAKLT